MTDWSDIVRRHGPLVWQTAYRLLSNEADASDCFQDAFVSAVKLSRRETIRHWPAVLKRLTTARALELLRRRYRDAERNEDWPDVPLPDNRAAIPSQRLLDCEVAEQLRLALSKLDHRQAEVFCLSTFEELGYREVARQLDISVNHVGVLLHRAKKSLQDQLENYRPLMSEPRSREEQS